MILDICNDPSALKVFSNIKIIITIIMIVVPIILLFSLTFKFIQASTKGNEDALASIKKKAVPNIIAAALIFLVPLLINLLLNITPDFTGYNACLTNATPEGIEASYEIKLEKMVQRAEETININDYNTAMKYLDKIDNEEKKEEYNKRLEEVYKKIEESRKIKIVSITVDDVVVQIDVKPGKKGVGGYYFSSIEKTPEVDGYDWIETNEPSYRAVKFPGTYYVYAKDTEGNIVGGDKVVVPEVFDVTFKHEGKKLMPVTIASYLKKHGSNIDEFNRKLASYNKKYGLRTRESVVVGAMAFTSEIQSWGYYLPYEGKYAAGNKAISKDAWGVHQSWGGGDKTFLACNPFVVWTYKQAGLNIYANRSKMGKYTPDTWVNKNGTTQKYVYYTSESYARKIPIFSFFVAPVGSKKKIGDNIKQIEKGLPGDILQKGYSSAHEMLVVDKYDDDMDGKSDGYIVLQSRDIGLCYEKVPHTIGILYDMSAVFDNTAGFADMLEGWQQYYIPTSDYPAWLK